MDRSTKGNRQWKLCYTPPDGTRAPGGYNSKRNVSVYIAGPMQMYAPVPIQPGRYSYSGIPLYVGSYGQDNDQDGVSTLQISTSLNVVRVCSISDVSQDNFTIIAGRETEFSDNPVLNINVQQIINQFTFLRSLVKELWIQLTNISYGSTELVET